jgi:hypothetical protein
VSPELEGYVRDFENLVGKEFTGGATVENDLPATGMCKDGNILIRGSDWSAFGSSAQRHALIYHELTHCMFGLGHSPSADSYMNAKLPKFSNVEEINLQVLKLIGH